jgi:hypothetical protein
MKTKKTATKQPTAKSAKAWATKPVKATTTAKGKASKPTARPDAKRLSQIEAAIQVLAKAGVLMN